MNPKNKGFDRILIISIFLIVIGVATLLFISNKLGLFNRFTKLTSKNQISTPKDFCGYAKATLNWLDSSRDQTNKYYVAVNCDSQSQKCDQGEVSGQSGHDALATLWARYTYIQKTGDKDEISKLKKDIDIYFSQLDLMEVQNDFWNCRLLLQMTDQKILDAESISKLEKLCLTSTYIGTDDVKNTFDENMVYYPQVVSPVDYFDWQNIEESSKKYSQIDSRISGSYSYYVAYPGDFVARYKLNQDKKDLDIANAYFNRLLIESYINSANFLAPDRCLLAISSLDLYSVNKDQKYLDWAKTVHNFYFTDHGIKTEAQNPSCALLNHELSKYDNDPKYQANHKKILDDLIYIYWDGSNNPRSFSNQGGFLISNTESNSLKNLRQNALLVNLLCQ